MTRKNPLRCGTVLVVILTLLWAPAALAPGETASTAPAPKAEAAPDPHAGLWKEITPEELERIIRRAEATRLKEERRKAAAEIRDDLLYEEQGVAKAVAVLTEAPAANQTDNLRRICEAFALADERFAKPHELYRKGQYSAAAAAAKGLRDPKKTGYLSAATHFLYADALDKHALALAKGPAPRPGARSVRFDAIEAYRDLLVNMPERISFAVTAGLRAAEAYEQLGRYYYATQMYQFCLQNYGLTMDAREYERLRLKIAKWQEIYKSPLVTIAGKMGQIEKRLALQDSGKQTQATGREVVMLLEDLIKTIEEKQCGGKSSSAKSNRDERKGEGEEKGKGKEGSGSRPGRGGRTGQPTKPMETSALVPGQVARPTKLSAVRPTKETGEWAKLPPRKRQQLHELMRRGMSERSRDLIRDYLSAVAKSGRPETPEE